MNQPDDEDWQKWGKSKRREGEREDREVKRKEENEEIEDNFFYNELLQGTNFHLLVIIKDQFCPVI